MDVQSGSKSILVTDHEGQKKNDHSTPDIFKTIIDTNKDDKHSHDLVSKIASPCEVQNSNESTYPSEQIGYRDRCLVELLQREKEHLQKQCSMFEDNNKQLLVQNIEMRKNIDILQKKVQGLHGTNQSLSTEMEKMTSQLTLRESNLNWYTFQYVKLSENFNLLSQNYYNLRIFCNSRYLEKKRDASKMTDPPLDTDLKVRGNESTKVNEHNTAAKLEGTENETKSAPTETPMELHIKASPCELINLQDVSDGSVHNVTPLRTSRRPCLQTMSSQRVFPKPKENKMKTTLVNCDESAVTNNIETKIDPTCATQATRSHTLINHIHLTPSPPSCVKLDDSCIGTKESKVILCSPSHNIGQSTGLKPQPEAKRSRAISPNEDINGKGRKKKRKNNTHQSLPRF